MADRPDRLQKEAVLRVGEVSAVTGRKVFISVDRDKNLSELFYDGDVIRNIGVGSYVDIRKGFLSLIGKVEGENAQTDDKRPSQLAYMNGRRFLSVSLVGFLDRKGEFFGGTKELPLVGNEAFLLTKEKVHQVHNLLKNGGIALDIARSEYEGFDISLPVDGLMNSHIAIFGNTGSGKSNTLAKIYQEFIAKMRVRNAAAFEANCRVVLFDFNNEYIRDNCLTQHKRVFNLSTRNDNGDKIPLGAGGFNDIEIVSILADATEKTQKPFLKRALKLQQQVNEADVPANYLRAIVQRQVTQVLQMSDKIRADLLLDYLRQVLPESNADGEVIELAEDLEWHNGQSEFRLRGQQVYLRSTPDRITETIAYKAVALLELAEDDIKNLVTLCYVQLISDVLANRAQNEHIAPAINKLKSKQGDIRKIFDPVPNANLFTSNVLVFALSDINLEMKKTVPLLVAKKIYEDHKRIGGARSLNIVIDEAHNILSRESFRESESWKDYRLETFEEIIKEGRKFGVFVTISSQRPNDISHTITSQAHNYFIHRLINQKDLQSIASAVSYIDKLTEESIPTLPTGTCIFSGMAGQMPLKLAVKPLDDLLRPKSETAEFVDLVPGAD
ncbi:ATP-binding protein [Pseudochrobactrum kiredjianiae]|uniref:ATP-binding protein n=1 Tax=Pseudochrobactrum kiredjianiae TaxID=386305 RepID=A0ABW3V1D8_9HYPH|nr:ATP-binding protein [Pseudochrobactrum kiredjianiae]MDM7853267.1 ATP-binding protein [Pseudochrobactrum kiredjianiae]